MANGSTARSSGSKRGHTDVDSTSNSGTGFETYMDHIWSEADWYEESTDAPPKHTLGNWKVDEGVTCTGYLLDKKLFPPKAGLPKTYRLQKDGCVVECPSCYNQGGRLPGTETDSPSNLIAARASYSRGIRIGFNQES